MKDQRLVSLATFSQPQYLLESPLLIEACALYLDRIGNACVAQIKWRNIGDRTVKAVLIKLLCFDTFGQKIDERDYQYDRLSAEPGVEFGAKSAIVLNNSKTAKYQVMLKAIRYDDGFIWQAESPLFFTELPKSTEHPFTGKLLAQYKRDLLQEGFETDVKFETQKKAGLWQCACGSWQRDGYPCLACGVTETILHSLADMLELEQRLKVYEERQRVLRLKKEEQLRKKQAEERRRKRIRLSIAGCFAACIVFACSAKFYFIPKHYYDLAKDLEISGKYDEAVSMFEKAEGFRDAAEQIVEAYYKQAETLLTEKKWDEAHAAFVNACEYSDAVSRINEPYYKQAEALMADGKWDDASAAFEKAGDFSDAASRINEPYYKQAEALLADGDEEGAIAAFKKAGDYFNAQSRWQWIYYTQAEALMTEGKWNEASVAFANAGEYGVFRINEPYCLQVEALLEEERYSEARSVFFTIKDYEDIEAPVKQIYQNHWMEMLRGANIGECIIFGTYEQDNNSYNGAEFIEWLVLAKEKDRIFVISRCALDCKIYSTYFEKCTWEESTLRKWLNEDFINTAFREEERARIQAVTILADRESVNNTQDRVFLLNSTEAEQYFSSDSARRCELTAYAKSQGAYSDNSGFCWWWLRTNSPRYQDAMRIVNDGTFGSIKPSNEFGAVRPALWIDLE